MGKVGDDNRLSGASGQEDKLAKVVEMIASAKRVVALTGSGISVESGIPCFRGAQGLWEKYDPMEYAHIDSFKANPGRVWEMLRELHEIINESKPNPAHLALAELERLDRLNNIITQNVDNLHQAAGSTQVIEFHGNAASVVCLNCQRRYGRDEISLDQLPPRCECAGVLKPDVVFFGEPIPERALIGAVRAASECDLMLVVGTSALVAPASHMPLLALQSGAGVVEINLEPTVLTNQVANITLLGSAGQILATLVKGVSAALSG